MATRAKAKAALQAMKDIGIPDSKTKPVLKKLLKLFDKNWELIEEENYRLLADSIFEYEDTEAAEKEKKTPANTDQRDALEEEAQMQDEAERPLKRLRLKHRRQETSSDGQPGMNSGTVALKIPKPEPGEDEAFPSQKVQPMMASPQSNAGNKRAESQPVSPQTLARNKGKQPISPQDVAVKKPVTPPSTQRDRRASRVLQIKEPMAEPGVRVRKEQQKRSETTKLLVPKDEPFTDDTLSLEPLAIVIPEGSHPDARLNSTKPVDSQEDQLPQSGTTKLGDGIDNNMGTLALATTEENSLKEADVTQLGLANIDIASTSQGVVKLCLSCLPSPNLLEFHASDVEVVLKKVEDSCISTYKIMNPNFSIKKLMRKLCDGVLEHETNPDVTQEKINMQDSQIADVRGNNSLSSLNDSVNAELSEITNASSSDLHSVLNGQQVCLDPDKSATDHPCAEWYLNNVEDMNTRKSMVAQFNPDDVRHRYDKSDITRGEEEVKVPMEKSNCGSPPFFHYIAHNVVSQSAHVVFSLAHIGEDDCCTSCDADCLASSSPCNCAQYEGEYSYTSDGLVREEFLEECISIIRNPQKHNLRYCQECPLERLKNEDMLDPCKGHVKRKFIKECWTKCSCNKYCGNRVVQGGITCNLQVFWTPEGKGWGLRTLEDIPKGSFICEYVGEILTTMELHKRKMVSSDHHSHSVVLDADWGSRPLREEEVLCLDATFYGNVARFINHRCSDANLIEIPVEVESPYHHYYHVALFAARKIDAFEELTWDYGVDFDDNELQIKAFDCLCESKFCRNMKRSSRCRSVRTLR